MPTTQISRRIIRVANPPLDGNPRTYLTSDVAVSGIALPVISTTGDQFLITGISDYYVIVEDYAREKGEITLIDADGASTNASSFTCAALKFSHEASDPVTFIPYNQIRIYGAETTGGIKTLIATLNIDVTQQFTECVYEGSTYPFFYTAYYNSTDDEISDYSDEITTTTLGQTSARKIIESAARKALTSIDEGGNSKLNWDITIDILNDGLDEIIIRKKKWSFLHTIDNTSVDTVASTAYISKPDNLAILEHLIINSFVLRYISKYEYDRYTNAGTTVSSGKPEYFTLKNDKIYLYPTPSTATDVTFEYYKYPTTITELSDEIDKAFITILIHYCASHFCYIRGNDKRGDKMFAMFSRLLEQQVEEYSGPDQLGDSEVIEQVNSIFQEEELI